MNRVIQDIDFIEAEEQDSCEVRVSDSTNTGKKRKLYIESYGCQMNFSDSEIVTSILAETATIIGEVTCGNYCTFWFNSVVRGDVNSITIGDYTNIQDGAVIHGTYQTAKTVIGSRVSIGHNAIVHGCTLEDEVLVGMGALIMDNARVGTGSIIAAGAIVLAGTIVPPGTVFGGNPARKLKDADDNNKDMIKRIAKNYPEYAEWFK